MLFLVILNYLTFGLRCSADNLFTLKHNWCVFNLHRLQVCALSSKYIKDCIVQLCEFTPSCTGLFRVTDFFYSTVANVCPDNISQGFYVVDVRSNTIQFSPFSLQSRKMEPKQLICYPSQAALIAISGISTTCWNDREKIDAVYEINFPHWAEIICTCSLHIHSVLFTIVRLQL